MATKGRVKIIGSNLNLPPKQAATWGIAQHRKAMNAAGYSGMAYYPIRGRMAFEMALGAHAEGLVDVIHQPWREATATQVAATVLHGARIWPSDPTTGKALLFEAAMNAGMPRMEGSGAKLARLAGRVGKTAVPLVVHPYGQMLGDGRYGTEIGAPRQTRNYHALSNDPRVGELQWQPSADFAANHRVLSHNSERTAALMVEAAHSDGLGRAAFDANHAAMVRRGGHRFSGPDAIAAWLAANGHLGAFEFALQPNFGGSIADLDEIMDGNIASTPQGRMLEAAASNMPPGDDFIMKVEIPEYAFTGPAGQGLGMASAAAGHARLVPILYDYAVNNLPAAG